jgi:transposase
MCQYEVAQVIIMGGPFRVILRRELGRGQVEAVFALTAPTEIALEAYAGSQHWGRTFRAMGHQVKLIY